jgi:type VI protein secretion system component Hcp
MLATTSTYISFGERLFHWHEWETEFNFKKYFKKESTLLVEQAQEGTSLHAVFAFYSRNYYITND